MKNLKMFFAVLLTVVTLTHSKPSQAAVGAIVSAGILTAGLYIGGAAVAGTVVGGISCLGEGGGDAGSFCGGMVLLVGATVLALGLVVMDGEQGVQFTELTPDQAKKLGISKPELVVYNSEIDQANVLVAEVQAELSKIDKPTAQDSLVAWSAVKDLVSSETYSTMQKIVSQK
ncbi:MAG: hypothetical protein ACJ76H_03195 [Bacteriovoracaceae bacterium]